MAYTQQLNNLIAKESHSEGTAAVKLSAIFGLASGLASVGLYYLYLRLHGPVRNQDQLSLLKAELVKELRKREIEAPKDADFTLTREFMVYLYRQLYTYQTIGKEVAKETQHERRVHLLKAGEVAAYRDLLDNRQKDFQ